MTTAVASISVTLEPDDNWTVVTVRRQDDLPAHVKSSSLGRGAIWSTEPQNKPPSYKCNVSGTLRAVEFINDAWYLLAYSALYGAYRTRARDRAPRENRYGLGWWTDEELVQQSLPQPLPPTASAPPQPVRLSAPQNLPEPHQITQPPPQNPIPPPMSAINATTGGVSGTTGAH